MKTFIIACFLVFITTSAFSFDFPAKVEFTNPSTQIQNPDGLSQDSVRFYYATNTPSVIISQKNNQLTFKWHFLGLGTDLDSIVIRKAFDDFSTVIIGTKINDTVASISTGNLAAGEYTIIVFINGYDVSINLTINTELSIKDLAKEDVQLSVYPNPATDYVTARFTTENSNSSVYVYSLSGQLVFSDEASRPAGTHEVPVDLTAQAPGIYLVKVAGSTFKVVKR